MAIVTVTQALKKLYKAIVGEDTTKNNPTKIISELADNWSGGGGGGGSSDFTTAEVTLINQLSASATFYFPVLTVWSDEELITASSILVGSGQSVNADIVLYKDASYGYTNSRGTITVSGDVLDNDGDLIVTGDGTITISGGGAQPGM